MYSEVFMRYIALLVSLLLTSCLPQAGGGSTAPATSGGGSALQGDDLTGVYDLIGLECYNFSNGSGIAVDTTFSGSSPTEVLTISANSMSLTYNMGSCTATETAHVVFSGAPNYTRTNRATTISTGSNCGGTYTSNDMNVSPAVHNVNYSNNALPDMSPTYYMVNGSELALRAHNLDYNSHGWCFKVYQRR
jgi:hypothetical protein